MTVAEVLARFWPLLVLQLALLVAGLVDISRRKATKYLPRLAWVVIIVLVGTLGPIAYFLLGRGEE
ncbi:MAG: PLD nuclease N-terminal domain-containing protein [Bacillota bacterium]